MLVSAVIPFYNAKNTLESAVLSILNQTTAVDEIILVNDGSIDNSIQVVHELSLLYSCIKIINKSNAGVCTARNNGITAANGEYILMLDADDFYEPGFVEKALLLFKDNPTHAAVMCGYYKIINGKKSKAYFPKEVDLKSCLFNNGMIACVLFKKQVLVEVGLYDPAMKYAHEDWDLNIRLLKSGHTLGIIHEALFNYTATPNSRSYISQEKDIAMRMRLYEKYQSDYEYHSKFIYQSMITDLLRVRRQNERIIHSRSYKYSKSVVDFYIKLTRFFKK